MHWLLTAIAAGSALLGLPVGASKLTPPVVPLVVRNPYLSTWLGDARETPWNKWPMFWTGEQVRSINSAEPSTLRRPQFQESTERLQYTKLMSVFACT